MNFIYPPFVISSISSNKEIFDEAKHDYVDALKTSGHKSKLQYTERPDNNTDTSQNPHVRKKCRNRNVVWFNPPFNTGVKTNIGKEFLKLVDKNFPNTNPLSVIINRKTVKVSYSCTSNMAHIMQKHNKKILSTENKEKEKSCNCRNKAECPVNNSCLTDGVIYKATVLDGNDVKAEYIGCTELEFKSRYNLHTYSFRDENSKTATTLSSYVWRQKLTPKPPIKWNILKKCHKYSPGMSICDTCLSEKFYIIKDMNNPKNLNKRTDIGNKCVQHRKKHKLKELL